MNRIGRNRVRPTLQSWCFKVVLIWLHITGSDESPTNISVSQYYRPITDITLSAQTLSVAKTLFGDYNLERDVIIHNYLTSKWKKRKAKRNVSLSETLTLWYGRKWALVVTDPKNKKITVSILHFPAAVWLVGHFVLNGDRMGFPAEISHQNHMFIACQEEAFIKLIVTDLKHLETWWKAAIIIIIKYCEWWHTHPSFSSMTLRS